jgi:hypothetical protein
LRRRGTAALPSDDGKTIKGRKLRRQQLKQQKNSQSNLLQEASQSPATMMIPSKRLLHQNGEIRSGRSRRLDSTVERLTVTVTPKLRVDATSGIKAYRHVHIRS